MFLCSGIDCKKEMLFCRTYELEDIVWEESGKSYDHIVPCCGGKLLGDVDPRHLGQDVDSYTAKSNLHGRAVVDPQWWDGAALRSLPEVGSSRAPSSTSDGSKELCDPALKQNAPLLICQDLGSSDHFQNDCSMIMDDSSPAFNEPHSREERHEDGTNDLMDYDWPDIGGLDDIDAIFRNCDSALGQGNTGTADGLSWFSSSPSAIYGPDDTFGSALLSSCSGLTPMNSTSSHHGASSNFMTEKDQTYSDKNHSSLGCQPCGNWFGTDVAHKEKYTHNRQMYGWNDVKTSDIARINSIELYENPTMMNSFMGEFGTQTPPAKREDQPFSDPSSKTSSSQGSIQHISEQKFPDPVSVPFSHPSQGYLEQDPKWESSLSKMRATPTTLENDLSVDPLAHGATVPCSSDGLNYVPKCLEQPRNIYGHNVGAEGKMNELTCGRDMSSRRITEILIQKDASMSTASTGRTSYMKHGSQKDKQKILHPPVNVNIDSSALRESSCMTSGHDEDMSLEAASFQQLQEAVYRLDVRTKLRIRDGLFRLARSAELRHCALDPTNYSRECGDTAGLHGGEASNRSVVLIGAETETNPIDRSIAQLLFHSPLASATNS